jgi:hypothetical protein
VEWELEMQERADLVVVYFHLESLAPISLLELWLRARSGKVIAACPEGYRKRGNVQAICHRYGHTLVNSGEELRAAVVAWLREEDAVSNH